MGSLADALAPAVLFARSPRRVLTLTVEHLAEFRALQRRPDEYSGHIDVDAAGNLERVVAVRGHNVPMRGPDFEISFHTHAADYGGTHPDHPSRRDIVHLLYTAGVRGEVALHLLFTPRFVYAMRLGPEVANTVTEATLPAYEARVERAYAAAGAGGRSPEDPAFRCAWLAALEEMGVQVDVVGAEGDADVAYSRPLLVDVEPVEVSPSRVAATGLGLGLMALAVAMAWAERR